MIHPPPPRQDGLATHDNLRLRDSHDAHALFQSIRQGHLPLIRKRLTEPEQESSRAGQVFVWADREGALERWTDGHNWSPSRVRGPFLMYDDIPADTVPFLGRNQQQKGGERRSEQPRKKRLPRLPAGSSKRTYPTGPRQQGIDVQTLHFAVGKLPASVRPVQPFPIILQTCNTGDEPIDLPTVDDDPLLCSTIIPDGPFKSSISRKSKSSSSESTVRWHEQTLDGDHESKKRKHLPSVPGPLKLDDRLQSQPIADEGIHTQLGLAQPLSADDPPDQWQRFDNDSADDRRGQVGGIATSLSRSMTPRSRPSSNEATTSLSVGTTSLSPWPSRFYRPAPLCASKVVVRGVLPLPQENKACRRPAAPLAVEAMRPSIPPLSQSSPRGTTPSPARLGRQRYSRTSISSISSNDSITLPTAPNASAFRVDFSSSSSEEGLTIGRKGPPRLLPSHGIAATVVDTPSLLSPQVSNKALLSRVLYAPVRYAISREVKHLFGQLTRDVSFQASDSQLAARLQYAHRLVDLIDQDSSSLQLVLQRFLKTFDHQDKGFTALLVLSDVEPDDNLHLRPECSTARLLTLMTSGVNVYHRLLSFIGRDGGARGAAGIRFIISSHADKYYWSREESNAITSFAARIVQEQVPGSRPWLQGLSLLEQLMRGDSLAVPGSLSSLPEGTLRDSFRRAFEAASGVRINWTSSNPAGSGNEPAYQTLWTFLQLVRSSSTRTPPMDESLHYAVSNSSQLHIFLADTIVTTPPTASPLVSFKRCLALAAFASIVELKRENYMLIWEPELKEALFKTCFGVMLGRTGWQYEARSEVERTRVPKLFPHEDAYDVVRMLYLPVIPGVITDLLTKLAGEEDPYEKLKLLEPLLWLSRMPHEDLKIAILKGGVIPFLKTIVDMDLLEPTHPHYRIIVRSKGDALTCFGNFFEDMRAETSYMFVYPDMHETAQTITLDENMPRMLRGQAAFAMERYSRAHEPQH